MRDLCEKCARIPTHDLTNGRYLRRMAAPGRTRTFDPGLEDRNPIRPAITGRLASDHGYGERAAPQRSSGVVDESPRAAANGPTSE